MALDLANFAVDQLSKKGASYVEARLESHAGTGFLLKNGVVEAASFGETKGLGVRFIINGTLGFFDTNILEKNVVRNLIDSSLRVTKRSSKIGENLVLSSEKKAKAKYSIKQKVNFGDIDPEIKIKELLDLEKSLVASHITLPTRYFELGDDVASKYFVNSEGTQITSEIPRISLFYLFTVREASTTAQRMWHFGGVGGFECFRKWDASKKLPEEARALQEMLAFSKSPPKGNVDVVVAPEITGIMAHESVGHPYESDRILGREGAQAGESFATPNILGTKIGRDVVNVVDDPTLPGSFGFYLYDDEGVKARRKHLITEGKITEFLNNRETAAALGVHSNGSARALNFDVEAIVRMSNTFVLPGDYKEEELFEDVKLGVYMKNFMEWNIDDIRMNQKYVGSEAYLIEKGEIKGAVKAPVIEITTPALWGSIDAIANKAEYHAATCGKGEPMQGMPVWMGGPAMRIRKVKVAR